ncbi:hypothetical protein LEN26_018860 [Aphanomyces euteiches]|nr:hypothetical protein LEN26_018860 [Aphanomyces euteiches]
MGEAFKKRLQDAYKKDPTFARYAKNKSNYMERDGLYFAKTKNRQWRLQVPHDEVLKTEVIAMFHDSPTAAHPGVRRTQLAVSQWFAWATMNEDIHLYVLTCETCQRYKTSNQKPNGKLMPLPIPDSCWHTVTMDFITGLPVSDGYDSIMTIVCKLSKRPKYIRTHTTVTAEDVAVLFFDNVVSIHGPPACVISDRDPKFMSTIWKSLMEKMGIQHSTSTAYRAQTDGQTERQNRTLEDSLRCMCSYHGDDWSRHLSMIEYAHMGLVQGSHGMTPFEVDTGRTLPNLLFADLEFMGECTRRFSQERQETIKHAREHLLEAQKRQKEYYDKHRSNISFNPGDFVLLATRNLPLRHAQHDGNERTSKVSTTLYWTLQD